MILMSILELLSLGTVSHPKRKLQPLSDMSPKTF